MTIILILYFSIAYIAFILFSENSKEMTEEYGSVPTFMTLLFLSIFWAPILAAYIHSNKM